MQGKEQYMYYAGHTIILLRRAQNKAGQVRHEARVDTLGKLKVSWSDKKVKRKVILPKLPMQVGNLPDLTLALGSSMALVCPYQGGPIKNIDWLHSGSHP